MKPKARTADLIVQEVKDETLVYDLKKNKALCLNETIALVWKNCDGHKTVEQIRGALETQLDARVEIELIFFALNQLETNALIDSEPIDSDPFEGMSRREIIRKVGLTAMVALPIISAVAAPTAATAQSACNPGNLGGVNGNCDCPAGTPIGSSCLQGTTSGGLPLCNAPCVCTGQIDFGRVVFGACGP